jgi:CheY-like chemotaxis protein
LRHDLRTPLHQIIGYAELLEDEVRDAGQEKFVADLAKIRDAARKALEAVDEAVPSMPSPAGPTVFREPETEATTLAAAPDPEGSIPLAPAADPYLGPLGPGAVRLLVVDDNELNRDMLSRRLGSRGFAVEVAENGERALALIEGRAFDLVLLDVMMPEVDVFTVCRKIKEDPRLKDVPVIFLTAKGGGDALAEGFESGAIMYINKPFTANKLLTIVNTMLESGPKLT